MVFGGGLADAFVMKNPSFVPACVINSELMFVLPSRSFRTKRAAAVRCSLTCGVPDQHVTQHEGEVGAQSFRGGGVSERCCSHVRRQVAAARGQVLTCPQV